MNAAYHRGVGALRVNVSGLTAFAGRCDELATSIADCAPAGAVGTPILASGAAVQAAHGHVAGVLAASTARIRATALRLTAAGVAYDRQQASSAAELGGLGQGSG